jgi:hypothetical protein
MNRGRRHLESGERAEAAGPSLDRKPRTATVKDAADSTRLSASDVLGLQRVAGNRIVQRVIGGKAKKGKDKKGKQSEGPQSFADVLAREPDETFFTQDFVDHHLISGGPSHEAAEALAAARGQPNLRRSTALFLEKGERRRLADEARYVNERHARQRKPPTPPYVSRGIYTYCTVVRQPNGAYSAGEVVTGRVVFGMDNSAAYVMWAGEKKDVYVIHHLEAMETMVAAPDADSDVEQDAPSDEGYDTS